MKTVFSVVLGSILLWAGAGVREVWALENGDMEDGVDKWEAINTKVKIESVGESYEGSKSLKVGNSSTSSAGARQIVRGVTGSSGYEIRGWIYIENQVTKEAFIRVAWYESEDGSGRQLSTRDSEKIVDAGGWREARASFQAPEQAKSAHVRLMLSSKTAEETAWARFDAVTLMQVELTPTPEPTVKPTSTPRPTATSKPTATIKPSPTSSPTSTPTTAVVSVLGIEAEDEEEYADESEEAEYDHELETTEEVKENEQVHGLIEKSQAPEWIWTAVMGVGTVMLGSSVWLGYRKNNKTLSS